jgi:hypothetical protein
MVVQYLHGLGSTSKCVFLRWIRKSSSPGIHPSVCPSTVSPLRVLSREASFPSVGSCHGPDLGRPRGFAPPRRVTPRIGLWVCCTPLPVLEFATFLRQVDRANAEASFRTGLSCPRNAVHTPRRIPLASSRSASLQPLPSCCYLPLHTVKYTKVSSTAGCVFRRTWRDQHRSA